MADNEVSEKRCEFSGKSGEQRHLGLQHLEFNHHVSQQLAPRSVRERTVVGQFMDLAGAFLHDLGKIHELTYNRSFSYTTRGQLLGHMVIELEMLQAKVSLLPGFPAELTTLLGHLIISHHGQYEFGSPKLPMFPEALLLHYMDDLDSKMES